METYLIPMVPGPVRVPQEVLDAYQKDYGSGDLETEYLDLYNRCEADLQKILATRSKVAILTGEGMLALWSALKSCLLPGDRLPLACLGTALVTWRVASARMCVPSVWVTTRQSVIGQRWSGLWLNSSRR
jgi:hypothetical protein